MYVTLWWLVLFAVLPFFGRSQPTPDEVSGWRGVPPRPRFWRVVLATSGVAAAVWLGIWVVVQEGWLSLASDWMAP